MKRNTLFALIALGLGGVSVAHAQDYSSWYLAPRIGAVFPDSDRTTKSSLFGGIGAGVWVNPNFAVDFEYGINNADFKDNSPRDGHQWESVQLDVAGRYFFGDLGSGWRPYIMGGLGALRHKAYSGFLLAEGGYASSGGWDPMATAGVGIQYNMSDRLAFRGEIAARYDHDNNSLNTPLAASLRLHAALRLHRRPRHHWPDVQLRWCICASNSVTRRRRQHRRLLRLSGQLIAQFRRSRFPSTCVASNSSSTTRVSARSWSRHSRRRPPSPCRSWTKPSIR